MKKILAFTLSLILISGAFTGCGEMSEEELDKEAETLAKAIISIYNEKTRGYIVYDNDDTQLTANLKDWLIFDDEYIVDDRKYIAIINSGELIELYIAESMDSDIIGTYPTYLETNGTFEDIKNSYKEKADAIAAKRAEEQKIIEDLRKVNSKANEVEEIFEKYKDKYMPDGIDEIAICSNIGNDYYVKDLSDEIDKEVGGSWLIKYRIIPNEEISDRESYSCYWAENETSEYVGATEYSEYSQHTLTEGGIKEKFPENSDTKFITINEWNKKYEPTWQKDYDAYKEEELDKLRNQRFTNNKYRFLTDICYESNDVIGEFERYDNENYPVSSLSVNIVDGEIEISGSITNNTDYRRNLNLYIAFYNAAGEMKDKWACDVGSLSGGETSEFEFGDVPNCIDQLYYYQLLYVIDSKA